MNKIIQLAIERHGGLDLWYSVEAIEVDMAMSGALLETKGYPKALTTTLRIDPRVPRTHMTPYGTQSETGHFQPDRVWIANASGQTTEELTDPRASFEGHVWTTPWSELQRLYFASYAMWDYLTIPFVFAHPGFGFEDWGRHREDGEDWNAVRVTFPDDIPAHCPIQIFYFNEEGLLKRIDYQTDIAGGVASHYCYDPKIFHGLTFPIRRRVVQRTADGPKISGRTGVFMEYTELRVELK